jgi:hypothetical protein
MGSRFAAYASLATGVLVTMLVSSPAWAAAYKPTSDAQVLEHLAYKPSDPVARELGQLRIALRQDPKNLEIAVKLARRYYEMVAEEGDPRYLGYAQAALAPWWEMPEPPVEVQVLRASLRQFSHDFQGAIADLDQILKRDPRHEQARSLRAVLNIVQARYPEARADCTELREHENALIGQGCEAAVDGLTGKAVAAFPPLQAAFDANPQASDGAKMWILLRLAELAQRSGHLDVAEACLQQALALGITDTFLLAAYADMLLERKRPAEVVALLKDKVRSDVLLLRLAFAARELNLPTASEYEETLAARYAAAQLRGDTVHQQEESRFELRVRHNAKRALWLAQENWKVQREPRDARAFLEAAIAAKDPVGAQPVLQWLEQNHFEDPVLVNLGRQLMGGVK